MVLLAPPIRFVVMLSLLGTGAAATPPGVEDDTARVPLAQESLDEALERAKSLGKRVFLQVGGPNCVWCDTLDRLLTHEHVAPVMEREYVIAKIDVGRMKDAPEVLERYLPEGVPGIPWYAILDVDGEAIVTSNGPDGNIGYPVLDEGIEHFLSMVERTARNLDEDGTDRLKHALVAEASKIRDEAGFSPPSGATTTTLEVDAEGLPDLAGTWTCVSLTFLDKVQTIDSGLPSRWIRISGDQVTSGFGDEAAFVSEITHLDPTTSPRQINLTRLRDDQTILGIYELDEGTLTICTSHRGTRPTAFEATEADGNLLTVYRKLDSD
ncbi:TIGR03067 domain-containing protein [Tautonia sp. JC769]|uniref:TIGR03067 domain-containing protein n=1 Tax=Tautonia sp. JC769 TaxID=3232135 RepID=UPI00345A9270